MDCSDISDDPFILHLVSTKLTLTIHADGVAGRGGDGDKSPLTEYLWKRWHIYWNSRNELLRKIKKRVTG